MAYAHTLVAPHETPAVAAPERKRGLFRRLLDALIESRMQQAESEITRYLASTGGKFTDEAERVIERRFLHNPNW